MKGDAIEVVVASPSGEHTITITASKGGRTVRQTYRDEVYNRKTTKWLDIEEVSRPTAANPTGRPTGTKASVRLDAVLSVMETRLEPIELGEHPAKPVSITEELGLD
jgi:hypothetical protein